MSISSTRWDHELILRHPNGEGYPINKQAMIGTTSFTPTGYGWWNSYHYFNADAQYHPELPWYVEDGNERLGPNPASAELINWIATPTPLNLIAAISPPRAIALRRDPNRASGAGNFEVERQIEAYGTWTLIASPPVSASAEDYLL